MKALILLDLQNDFMPWGSVEVHQAGEIIPLANKLMDHFDLVLATQDWHPADHLSFAASHPWRLPRQIMKINGIDQMLWTIHCVQDSMGADLAMGLKKENISKIVRKGERKNVDAYGAFYENDEKKIEETHHFFAEYEIDEVYILGLPFEFGVKLTAISAVLLGFKTNIILDACGWLSADEKEKEKMILELKERGIKMVHSKQVLS